MQTAEMILAEDYCQHHQVEITFINSLHEYGLIEVTCIEENNYIPFDELGKVEQLMRLYYDLQINLEGLDAISHLLDKVNTLQSDIVRLKNRLKLYEDEAGEGNW